MSEDMEPRMRPRERFENLHVGDPSIVKQALHHKRKEIEQRVSGSF